MYKKTYIITSVETYINNGPMICLLFFFFFFFFFFICPRTVHFSQLLKNNAYLLIQYGQKRIMQFS